MRSTTITNIQELKIEINRLKALDNEQIIALKMRFSSPSAIFASALTLFPRSAAASGVLNAGLFKQDFVSLISRFLIPLTLNKTVFRHSNFLVKLIVGLVSQKASGYVTESAVDKVIREGKSLIGKFFHKKAAVANDPALKEMNNFKKIGIIAGIAAVVILAGIYYYRYHYVFGDGTKAGTMNYFVHKGYLFKTYEGRLIQAGIRTPAQGNIQSNKFMFP